MSDIELQKIKSTRTDTYMLRQAGSQQLSLPHYERIHRAANDIDDLRMRLRYIANALNDAHLRSAVNSIMDIINSDEWKESYK